MVDISQMNKVLELPSFVRLAGKKLVQVEAGISIRQLNSELDKRNLSVVTLGGIDHQTLAGAIATGTHGSGIDLPAVHGMVRSVVLVAGDGKTYRIEPSDGVSDPANYNEPGITLIQSDDDFNAVLVSLGCMGIIYSCILEVLDMYWLEESKQMDKWSVRHFAEQGKIYMTSPVGMRFVKASGAYLAPDYGRDVCYIDTPFLQGIIGADELLEACQDIMFAGGGFPHWGKKNSRLSAHMDPVAKTFPKLAAWKNIQKKFDPEGIFANNYTSRFLLT